MNKRQAETDAFHGDVTKLRSFLRKVNRKLAVYGSERHGNRRNPLEELVFIILSAQTESYLYVQTFKNLRRRFPTWNSLGTADEAGDREQAKGREQGHVRSFLVCGLASTNLADGRVRRRHTAG